MAFGNWQDVVLTCVAYPSNTFVFKLQLAFVLILKVKTFKYKHIQSVFRQRFA